MTSGIKQADLDKLAALVNEARHNMASTQVSLAAAYHLNDHAVLPRLVVQAQKASRLAESAVVRLVALGAKRPGVPVAADALSIHLLDTPETRRLLAALDAAVDAAALVDRQRGWVDADGESTGWGETLAGLAFELRQEVEGTPGRD